MRTTDFCFPLPDYEYPCLVSYRHLFEAYASPLADGLAPARTLRCGLLTTTRPVDLAFHDAKSASVGCQGLTHGVFCRRSRSSRTSDTPVATGPSCCRLSRASIRFRPPRSRPSSLREDETKSMTRGAFHRQANRESHPSCLPGSLRFPPPTLRSSTRMRGSVPVSCAFTCVYATTRPSAPLHPRLLETSALAPLQVAAS